MEPDSSLLSEYEDAPEGTVRTIVDNGDVVDFVQMNVRAAFVWWDRKPWAKEVPPGTMPRRRIPKKVLEMSKGLPPKVSPLTAKTIPASLLAPPGLLPSAANCVPVLPLEPEQEKALMEYWKGKNLLLNYML